MPYLTQKGNFNNLESFFKKHGKIDYISILKIYGELGVSALSDATPKDTGKTAASWGYTIEKTKKEYIITWTNSNINDGVNIALILQYGHGTDNGAYIKGIDYINPSLTKVFNQFIDTITKEVLDG